MHRLPRDAPVVVVTLTGLVISAVLQEKLPHVPQQSWPQPSWNEDDDR